MSGALITPRHRDVPAGLSIIGLENGGIAPLSLRQLYAGIVMHALVSRETSTLAPLSALARQAASAADALLGALSPAPATPEGPERPATGG